MGMECQICGQSGSVRTVTTYKSLWLVCDRCNCFARHTRSRYPLEFLPGSLSRGRLGRRAEGAEYYRYYEKSIERGDRGKWANDFAPFHERVRELNLSVDGAALLDISGEPGFFGQDAKAAGASSVTVTAYAPSVAAAMRRYLDLDSRTYDFNTDDIRAVAAGRFHWITCRYAIGFCERLDRFFTQAQDLLESGGLLYLAFSPPSLAVCSRWMFDDYTYLRQYTLDYVLARAAEAGFQKIRIYDDGSYRYYSGVHWLQRAITEIYRHILCRQLIAASEYSRMWQHNVALLLRKSDLLHRMPPLSNVPAE